MSLELIILGLRALASVAPVLIREGHGERVQKTLDTLATLGERGEEAYQDLRALVGKLQDMQGVDRLEQDALWAQIEDAHAAIQAAAASLPPRESEQEDPKEEDSGPQDGDPDTGDDSGGDPEAPAAGESAGSGEKTEEDPTE